MFGKKEEKVNKVKSALPQRIGRIVLWVLVVFLIFRGIGSVLKTDDSTQTKEVINQFEQTETYKAKAEREASAFASMFAVEYMTYKGDQQEYQDRLKKYSNLELSASYNDKIEALTSEAFQTKWRDTNKLSVDVKVKVRYYVKNEVGTRIGGNPNLVPVPSSTTKTEDAYIRIPIAEKDGKYLVEGIPVFIAAPDKGPKTETKQVGNEVTGDKKKDILAVVENFLKAYCSGNDVEISYYMADTKIPVKGLQGRFIFKDLDDENTSVRELQKTDEGKFVVTVQYEVNDSINNQVFKQSMEIKAIFKDSKYLIESYDVKLSN